MPLCVRRDQDYTDLSTILQIVLTLAERRHVAVPRVDALQNVDVALKHGERRLPAVLPEVIELVLRRVGHDDEHLGSAAVRPVAFSRAMMIR